MTAQSVHCVYLSHAPNGRVAKDGVCALDGNVVAAVIIPGTPVISTTPWDGHQVVSKLCAQV